MNILQYGCNAYFDSYLKAMGHNVFTFAASDKVDFPLWKIFSMQEILAYCEKQGFKPDIFFYADDGRLPLVYGIEDLAIPAVFYSIDTYCNGWHGKLAYAFDYVLYAQHEEQDFFRGVTESSEYFPLFAYHFSKEESFEEWKKNRDIPVSFIGNMNQKNNAKRYVFYSAFKKKHPIFITQGSYVPVYSRSRIVLNQSAAGEINFRTFEAMALGCGCISDCNVWENGDFLFQFMENSLPLYPEGDADRAAQLCKYWLLPENEPKLYEIAMKGRDTVKNMHSARLRAERLHDVFLYLHVNQSHKKRLAELAQRKEEMKKLFAYFVEDIDFAVSVKEQFQSVLGKY